MEDYLLMMVSAMFINNIALIRFMGNCPIVGVSSSMSSAVGMSFAVIFVTTLAGTTCWIIQKAVLEVFNLEYLQTLVFILVIASNVQITEMVVQKVSPPLYRALGIYLPLITTNCMVFGISLLNIQAERSFMETLVYSVSAAMGFAVVLIILAAIRERMAATARVPGVLQGVPITLITAGIMALSFAGLLGLD
ncbi:electron transport complex protein RnfA [Desulfonatronovibrio hydrogenovorans]|uniref:electron transport complex protein RnfA n=1 Tax=Desulfonatronovibrio hydrogenovorans TaxID=53245 RepID=UPI00048DAAA5|nr:RnfABCDGE type electron transport complex subunit A [Desulfonatronovibrio hydrogenovorans]